VIAIPEELDWWTKTTPMDLIDEVARLKAKIAMLEDEVNALRAVRHGAPPRPVKVATVKLA
jgi:hypothetical protein